jgi:hypothetical protein
MIPKKVQEHEQVLCDCGLWEPFSTLLYLLCAPEANIFGLRQTGPWLFGIQIGQ